MSLTRDAVFGYMKRQTGPVCATWLSEALGRKFDGIMDAMSDICVRRDLPIRMGSCSKCGITAYILVPLGAA